MTWLTWLWGALAEVVARLVRDWQARRDQVEAGASQERERAKTEAERQEADAIRAGNRDEPIKYRD